MPPTLPLLIMALVQVESRGNDRAMGDYVQGVPTAFGCLQISQAVIEDVSRVTGKKLSTANAFNRRDSIWICEQYLAHYATAKRLGREPTLEDCARIWNGGPNGWRKPETEKYWAKVRAQLDTRAGVWRDNYALFTPAKIKR